MWTSVDLNLKDRLRVHKYWPCAHHEGVIVRARYYQGWTYLSLDKSPKRQGLVAKASQASKD